MEDKNLFLNDNNDENKNEEGTNNAINNYSSKISLPFLKVNIEKISDLNNISNKLENSHTLINSQTDKLLIAGFEGDEDDFKECYKKIEPINNKKVVNIKHKKLNKLLVKDDFLGPIKLTKIKEFKMTVRQKNKLLEKINQLKTLKNNSSSQYNRYYKRNKSLINKIINNNTSKFNNSNMNSSINGNNLFYYNKSSTNNILSSKTNNFYDNSLNSVKGSYFFYKNRVQNRSQRSNKSRSISQNNLITLRDILTTTSHNIKDINKRIKNYIRKNKDIYTISYSDNQNKKPKKIKIKINKNKNKKSNLHDVLDSLKKRDKDQILKQIKKDEGTNSQNIWIKKSTANLVSFGKAFLYLADDLFYREHKRIIAKYPDIEKDADLPVVEKDNSDIIKKMHKMKMEHNSRLMRDLNYNNKILVNLLNKRMKKSNSNEEIN